MIDVKAFVLGLAGLVAAAIVSPAMAACTQWDLSGDWEIDTPKGNFTVVITQDGTTLRGESAGSPSVIEGTISGNQTTITMHAVDNPMQGRVYEGSIDENGQWDGFFHAIDDPAERWSWVGMRKARCLAEGAAAPDSGVARTVVEARMTGKFNTPFGVLDLTLDGGMYGMDGRLSPTSINGMVMEGIWTQEKADRQCDDGSYRGKFVFTFTETGFTGVYGYCDEEPTIPGWDGTKIQ